MDKVLQEISVGLLTFSKLEMMDIQYIIQICWIFMQCLSSFWCILQWKSCDDPNGKNTGITPDLFSVKKEMTERKREAGCLLGEY